MKNKIWKFFHLFSVFNKLLLFSCRLLRRILRKLFFFGTHSEKKNIFSSKKIGKTSRKYDSKYSWDCEEKEICFLKIKMYIYNKRENKEKPKLRVLKI